MRNFSQITVLLLGMTLVSACGNEISEQKDRLKEDSASALSAAIPARTYQIKSGSLSWETKSSDTHTFVRPFVNTNSFKYRFNPTNHTNLYANNSDYVQVVSADQVNFGRCLTATYPANGIGGDLIWTVCAAKTQKDLFESQKFYINRTVGSTASKLMNYKAFFLNYPEANKKALCVIKSPNGPILSAVTCENPLANNTALNTFNLIQLN